MVQVQLIQGEGKGPCRRPNSVYTGQGEVTAGYSLNESDQGPQCLPSCVRVKFTVKDTTDGHYRFWARLARARRPGAACLHAV